MGKVYRIAGCSIPIRIRRLLVSGSTRGLFWSLDLCHINGKFNLLPSVGEFGGFCKYSIFVEHCSLHAVVGWFLLVRQGKFEHLYKHNVRRIVICDWGPCGRRAETNNWIIVNEILHWFMLNAFWFYPFEGSQLKWKLMSFLADNLFITCLYLQDPTIEYRSKFWSINTRRCLIRE